RRRVEILADRADRAAILVLVGAGSDVEHSATLQLLEARVVEHELPLAAVVGEADGDEAARLDPDDDALAERRVADGVAGREIGGVLLGRDLALPRRAVARPRGRPQALALAVRLGELVEEARRQFVVAAAVEHP